MQFVLVDDVAQHNEILARKLIMVCEQHHWQGRIALKTTSLTQAEAYAAECTDPTVYFLDIELSDHETTLSLFRAIQNGRHESYIVYVHIDEESYRIVASAKVEKYFAERHPFYNHGQEVDLLVWQKTEMGFKVIIDNCYPGLVYEDQVFRYLHTGDRVKGYIGTVRPDGKIDVTLQPTGRQQTLDFADTLLQYLKEHGGKCDLGDKSDAEDIKRRFQVSKKVFKKAVDDLYRQRLISIAPDGLTLN